MLEYIGKRILTGILSLFVLVTAAFFLTRMIPGSPFQAGNVSEDVLHSLEEEYGLDRPVTEQYISYMGNLLRGDLGVSYKKPGVSVADIIARAWPPTAALGGLAVAVSAIAGTTLGAWQAVSERKGVRGGIFLGTLLGTAIPNFAIALLLMLVLGVELKLLPVAGLGSWKHYILPVISLSAYPTAVITRLMHTSFRAEMRQDYVTMARAKGLKFWQAAFTHILRNAWIPVLNYIGPSAAFLMTGSFAVESIFTIPGLGREFVNSIANRDYTLILGLTVFMGVVVMGVSLATDLLCAWLDPRIRRAWR